MSYICTIHNWSHLFNACPSCHQFVATDTSAALPIAGTKQTTPQTDEVDWIDDDDVQELLKWLEQCTLAELIMAKEIIESKREELKQ